MVFFCRYLNPEPGVTDRKNRIFYKFQNSPRIAEKYEILKNKD